MTIIICITVFIIRAGEGVVHWVFAFKYFVIAKEIPYVLKILDPEDLQSNEKKYRIVEITGIIINVLFGALAATSRSLLSYQSSKKDKDLELVSLGLSWSCVILQLVSGLLLAYSVLKIRQELKEMPHLAANQSTFCLNITFMFLNVTVLSVSQFYIYNAFSNTTDKSLKI